MRKRSAGDRQEVGEGRVRFSVSFFFSSRRRHTRLQGDWSSDVCSSDLHVGSHEVDAQHAAHMFGKVGEAARDRSEEHTSELQSPCNLVCRLLLEKKKTIADTDQKSSDYHVARTRSPYYEGFHPIHKAP